MQWFKVFPGRAGACDDPALTFSCFIGSLSWSADEYRQRDSLNLLETNRADNTNGRYSK
ncbi:MAG: hypothetical protein ABJ361_13625 [Anderseniella sp.]